MGKSEVPSTPPSYDLEWAFILFGLLLVIEGICVFMAKIGGPWLYAHPWFQ